MSIRPDLATCEKTGFITTFNSIDGAGKDSRPGFHSARRRRPCPWSGHIARTAHASGDGWMKHASSKDACNWGDLEVAPPYARYEHHGPRTVVLGRRRAGALAEVLLDDRPVARHGCIDVALSIVHSDKSSRGCRKGSRSDGRKGNCIILSALLHHGLRALHLRQLSQPTVGEYTDLWQVYSLETSAVLDFSELPSSPS